MRSWSDPCDSAAQRRWPSSAEGIHIHRKYLERPELGTASLYIYFLDNVFLLPLTFSNSLFLHLWQLPSPSFCLRNPLEMAHDLLPPTPNLGRCHSVYSPYSSGFRLGRSPMPDYLVKTPLASLNNLGLILEK
jgi:hypothetical protein